MTKITGEQDTKISKKEERTKTTREQNTEILVKSFEDILVGTFPIEHRRKIEGILEKLGLFATFTQKEDGCDFELRENTWAVKNIEVFWDLYRKT